MITESCLAHLDMKLEGGHEQAESYEHLGEVKTINIDMHQRYKDLKESRRIFLTEKDAHLYFTVDFPTPPPLTWAISGVAAFIGLMEIDPKAEPEAEQATIAHTAKR